MHFMYMILHTFYPYACRYIARNFFLCAFSSPLENKKDSIQGTDYIATYIWGILGQKIKLLKWQIRRNIIWDIIL